MHIPKSVEKVGIHVKQSPGMSYPKPVKHVYIHEQARAPWFNFHLPWKQRHQTVGTDGACQDGQCVEEGGQVPVQGEPVSAPMEGPESAPGYVMPPDVH